MTAGLWRFLISLLWGLFQPKREAIAQNDPELLLQQAQQEMRENQAKNRERAVQAITQKNNLQAELDKTRRIVQGLESKRGAALAGGDVEEAQSFQAVAESSVATLALIEASLERATATTEAIKTAIRREEERIRAKTAQAMALKTQLRQEQIVASISLTASAQPLPSTEERLDAVYKQLERARDVLWNGAQAAITAGDYTAAIRMLTERQNIDMALVFRRNS